MSPHDSIVGGAVSAYTRLMAAVTVYLCMHTVW